MIWNVNLFQNGEPEAWDEHNMGPAAPMKIECHERLMPIRL